MNKKIEKFLIVASILYVLGIVLGMILPSLTQRLMIGEGANPNLYLTVSIISSLLSFLPTRIACAFWLRFEAKRIGMNSAVWFWAGLAFDILGVVTYYAFHAYRRSFKAEPVGSGQPR